MHRNIRTFLNKFCLLLMLLAIAACKPSQPKPPLAFDKMKDILRDIHLAEAYSSMIITDSVQTKMLNKNADSLATFYKQILAKHHTSLAQFEEAMKWYALHPQQLDTVYNHLLPVLDSLKTIPAKK